MAVLLIIIILLLLLLLLRVGVSVRFGGEQRVTLRVGPLKKELSQKEKAKKEEKPEKASAKPKKAKPKPTAQELLELAKTALTALKAAFRRLRRSVRIDPLALCVRFGGDDPANVAEVYGYANAAMWSLMPLAEETFDIPNPSIHLEADFEGQRIEAEGEVGVSLRIVDILLIALVLLVPLLKWYLRFQKAHKNDALRTRQTEETTEKTV